MLFTGLVRLMDADDVIYAHQTVSETLQMAADVRLRDASQEQRIGTQEIVGLFVRRRNPKG